MSAVAERSFALVVWETVTQCADGFDTTGEDDGGALEGGVVQAEGDTNDGGQQLGATFFGQPEAGDEVQNGEDDRAVEN